MAPNRIIVIILITASLIVVLTGFGLFVAIPEEGFIEFKSSKLVREIINGNENIE